MTYVDTNGYVMGTTLEPGFASETNPERKDNACQKDGITQDLPWNIIQKLCRVMQIRFVLRVVQCVPFRRFPAKIVLSPADFFSDHPNTSKHHHPNPRANPGIRPNVPVCQNPDSEIDGTHQP